MKTIGDVKARGVQTGARFHPCTVAVAKIAFPRNGESSWVLR